MLFRLLTVACLIGLRVSFILTNTKPLKASGAAVTSSLERRVLSVPLDHFDRQNIAEWDMPFYINNEFHQPGGPIFLRVTNRYDYIQVLEFGLMYDLAREFNATVVASTLRFYGEARPTNDTSLDNLVFLNTDQALADLAHLITFIKLSNETIRNAKVIAYGTDYGASLAVWARQKYPHLVDGVWASSARLQAVFDFTEQHENTANALIQIGGLRCYRQLERAYEQIEDLLVNHEYETIEREFNLCAELKNTTLGIATLMLGLAASYETKFYYGDRTDIEEFCELMTSDANEDDAFTRYARYKREIFSVLPCVDVDYESVREIFAEVEWDTMATIGGGRQFYYQTCSEFGHFASSSSPYQPFGNRFPIDIVSDVCADYFGPQFNEEFIRRKIAWTNINYGGTRPDVTNVYFTNGDMDASRSLGVLRDLNPSSPAVLIPGHSVASDTGSLDPINDSFFLHQAKLRVRDLVQQWIET